MKIGNEVEGRMLGIRTLFCTVDELRDVKAPLDQYLVQQIYVSDHDNVLNLANNDILQALSLKYAITVERTGGIKCVPEYINIMLVVENKSFWDLQPNDQIKFTKDLHVYAATKRTMTYTPPNDFAGDLEI